LKNGILSKLCNSGDIPDTLDGIVKKVIAIENAYQLLVSHCSRDDNYRKNNNNNRKSQRFVPSHQRDPNAMDVDRVNPLSDKEKQEHLQKGLCFYCGEKGHRANDPKFHPRNGDARKNNYGKSQVRRETPDDEERGDNRRGRQSVRREAPDDEPTSSKIEELDDDETLRRVDF
jgi:hypothetical protein